MKTFVDMSLPRHLGIGVMYGLRAWIAYGTAELLWFAYLSWLVERHVVRPQSLPTVVMTLLVYACVGMILGAFLSWTVSKIRPASLTTFLNAAATCTVLVAFGLNAFLAEEYLLSPRMLILPVLLFGAVASAGPGAWARQFAVFANPWAASFLCLGTQWLTREYLNESPRLTRLAVLAIGSAAILAAGWLFHQRKTLNEPVSYMRRALLLGALLAIALSAAAPALKPTPLFTPIEIGTSATNKPNVILIVLDTVRADHLSVYGYQRNTTPHLQSFAQQATLYTRSYSTGDMTLPSHASLFTGLYPSQHGAHYALTAPVGRRLDLAHTTLAEILAAQGYDTRAVVANGGYLTANFGFHQGFASYDQRLPVMPRSAPIYLLKGRIVQYVQQFSSNPSRHPSTRTAQEVHSAVFPLLDEFTREKRPFFLFINYMDAHYPYLPPSPFDRMFPSKDESFNGDKYKHIWEGAIIHSRSIGEVEHRHLVSQYDGAIAYLDDQLTRLFARLKELDLYDTSLLIITSDHGETFGERNFLDHGGMSVYQDQVFVPLLIKYPQQTDARVVDSVASGVDVFPTVLDVLGFEVPKMAQGQSLAGLNSSGPRSIFCESHPGGRALKSNPARFSRTYKAIVSGSSKLIRASDGKREFYDLSSDPSEQKNIYRTNAAFAREMDARLSKWMRSQASTTNKPEDSFDSHTLERLKSLGYVQ